MKSDTWQICPALFKNKEILINILIAIIIKDSISLSIFNDKFEKVFEILSDFVEFNPKFIINCLQEILFNSSCKENFANILNAFENSELRIYLDECEDEIDPEIFDSLKNMYSILNESNSHQ